MNADMRHKIRTMEARKDEQMEVWQTWCMRWTENPINEVRLLELPHDRATEHHRCKTELRRDIVYIIENAIEVESWLYSVNGQ